MTEWDGEALSGGVPAPGGASAPAGYVLRMSGISKSYPGVIALRDMRLDVRPGAVHVLMGENGAGKSTLMKILAGIAQVDAGDIVFRGKAVDRQDASRALELGISMIHQELSPVLDMSIAENLFLGREPRLAERGPLAAFVDFRKMTEETAGLLAGIGLRHDPQTRMRDLSIASMQLVEIVKAISRRANLIIMDEPTSAISNAEVDLLFEHISELKTRGLAIIYITHKFDEVFRIADDITVMRDGQFVSTGPVAEYDQARIISEMVGRTISTIFPKEEVPIGDEVLRVEGLTRRGAFEDVSFSVRRGEILGVAGLIGAGRTEVARAIFGLDPLDGGRIVLDGREVTIRSPSDAIAHGIAMVSEDRKSEGLVLCRSVLENASLANLGKFASKGFINRRAEAGAVSRMIDLLRVKTAGSAMVVENLSGGNQQKIVLAKWLLGDIKVLILDEPTRGIDVGSKSEIHRLMVSFARQGLAIVMISSELPEILGMSDRVVVMGGGRNHGEIAREAATQNAIMKLATGGHRV